MDEVEVVMSTMEFWGGGGEAAKKEIIVRHTSEGTVRPQFKVTLQTRHPGA